MNIVSFQYPKYIDMSKHHINLINSFLLTGIDFPGSILVLNDKTGNVGKMYILICPSLKIRTVHFELVPNMKTFDFILAFQRLCSYYIISHHCRATI